MHVSKCAQPDRMHNQDDLEVTGVEPPDFTMTPLEIGAEVDDLHS
jgi:hypothetical protein